MDESKLNFVSIFHAAAIPLSFCTFVGALLFLLTPLAIPAAVLLAVFWRTKSWPSAPKRIGAGIIASVAFIWLAALPSFLLGHYHLQKYTIPNVKASQQIRPSGHIASIHASGIIPIFSHSDNGDRTPKVCNYLCMRYLALPAVQTITLAQEIKTPFLELKNGSFTDSGHAVTLKLANGEICKNEAFEISDGLSSRPDFAKILETHCVVETTRPEQFDLITRQGSIAYDNSDTDPRNMNSFPGTGSSEYLRADYHETRLSDGTIISRNYNLTICPIAAPLFLIHYHYGFRFERECSRPDYLTQFPPIDGLDFSTE